MLCLMLHASGFRSHLKWRKKKPFFAYAFRSEFHVNNTQRQKYGV